MTWLLYLVDFLGNLNIVLEIITFLCSALLIATIIIYINLEKDDKDEKEITEGIHAVFRKSWILLILIILLIIMPSQKTMYLMLGTSYLQNSNTPIKVLEILNKKLNHYLEEEKENNLN